MYNILTFIALILSSSYSFADPSPYVFEGDVTLQYRELLRLVLDNAVCEAGKINLDIQENLQEQAARNCAIDDVACNEKQNYAKLALSNKLSKLDTKKCDTFNAKLKTLLDDNWKKDPGSSIRIGMSQFEILYKTHMKYVRGVATTFEGKNRYDYWTYGSEYFYSMLIFQNGYLVEMKR